MIQATVAPLWHGAVFLFPRPDDVGKVKLHLHARAVFHKRNAVSVTDFPSNGRKSDSELGVSLDVGTVVVSAHDLDVAKPYQKKEQGQRDDSGEDHDPLAGEFRLVHGTRGLFLPLRHLLGFRSERHQGSQS